MIFVKHFKMRFFANAQNDIVGRFFVILRPKSEGSPVLKSEMRESEKVKGGDSSPGFRMTNKAALSS